MAHTRESLCAVFSAFSCASSTRASFVDPSRNATRALSSLSATSFSATAVSSLSEFRCAHERQ